MSTSDYPYVEGGYTLYSNELCPYAQRALRAFDAANVKHKVEQINLKNKPSWYRLVNPQLKVPALRTPDGTILIESLVIAEFIADEFPESNLLSSNATERAQLRLFIELFGTRFNPLVYRLLMTADVDEQEKHKQALLAGLEDISKELERQSKRKSGKGGPFWYGKWGYAEITLSSFVGLLVPLARYRSFAVPETDAFAAFNNWRSAILQAPGFTKFKPDDNTLNDAYKKFVADV
ncbi:hypothetical protein GGH12_002107 [Coemansia sp. RSA 1822]|nr:hypothetical protein LPJ76_002567 [Coemansia sp. RSA 638]KAJ2543304.1 hypothetical protein GGF49_002190 [Coemansia sp. RSA 1853]KAJ2564227.1 hypothetical protein GGH12_002107 [Coemansia sp. RSA 1822]